VGSLDCGYQVIRIITIKDDISPLVFRELIPEIKELVRGYADCAGDMSGLHSLNGTEVNEQDIFVFDKFMGRNGIVAGLCPRGLTGQVDPNIIKVPFLREFSGQRAHAACRSAAVKYDRHIIVRWE